MTRKETADLIASFVGGSCGPCDWDDFVGTKWKEPEIQAAADFCVAVRDRFPPLESGQYCNEEGKKALLEFAATLRAPEGGAA
jgi:hypothetical protein